MKLEIFTPEAIIFKGDVLSVTLPGLDGEFQLLNNHTSIISAVKKGQIRIKKSGNTEDFNGEVVFDSTDKSLGVFEIKGGVLEMLNDTAIVLAE